MKNKKQIAPHILIWLLYIAYVYLGLMIRDAKKSSYVFSYSYMFIQCIEFYICYLWVFPTFLRKLRLLPLIGGIACTLFGFILARYLIEETFFPAIWGMRNYTEGTPLWFYIRDNLYYGSPAIFISVAVWSTREALISKRENALLREETVRSELAFLKSQVNPHFLYNTLNYIYSLAYPVSDKLANAIIKLSDLMRYMLNESPDGLIELHKEIEYLNNYIAIYRLRFEDHFNVNFTVEGQVTDQRIASLGLIPFVENAFKHGVVNDPTAPINILLKLAPESMAFTVRNKINNLQKDPSSGVGLTNIRRRLELLYPNKHQLDTIVKDGYFEIYLQIKFAQP